MSYSQSEGAVPERKKNASSQSTRLTHAVARSVSFKKVCTTAAEGQLRFDAPPLCLRFFFITAGLLHFSYRERRDDDWHGLFPRPPEFSRQQEDDGHNTAGQQIQQTHCFRRAPAGNGPNDGYIHRLVQHYVTGCSEKSRDFPPKSPFLHGQLVNFRKTGMATAGSNQRDRLVGSL